MDLTYWTYACLWDSLGLLTPSPDSLNGRCSHNLSKKFVWTLNQPIDLANLA
ncbi:hypothetical protein FA13DRAFT_1119924 [Coprinellus micaceus]|uniref:Uncharacterized protein n=1 Tax=Coprinellus micaceus TaxID=71717 RepID=A0A4Y7SIB5_COPMI|nr:hypothetical protein FA13DRAFT_133505 [Coprinellus micaceus]TEB25899.1 hypothetical protein FA13DRAFT_1119924 [Coprinellus micaceus]